MKITSTAIGADEHILKKYTCQGENVNPPLTFSEVPVKTKSLVLIMDDPDAPGGTFTHWVIYDMSPATLQITEDSELRTGRIGKNSFGKASYGGPCPPSGTHRYFFKLYALDSETNLNEGASLDEVMGAVNDHMIEKTELVGLYEKS